MSLRRLLDRNVIGRSESRDGEVVNPVGVRDCLVACGLSGGDLRVVRLVGLVNRRVVSAAGLVLGGVVILVGNDELRVVGVIGLVRRVFQRGLGTRPGSGVNRIGRAGGGLVLLIGAVMVLW